MIKLNEINTTIIDREIYTLKWFLKDIDYEIHFKTSFEFNMWY